MNYKLYFTMFLGLLTTITSTATFTIITSSAAVADINMAVFPRRPIGKTVKAFKPLATILSKELGEPVKLIVPKNFKAFWKGVKTNKYDLVHYNQYHYLLSRKEQGYKVIVANEERGSKLIAGSISVRKDSGINSINDLKGKTILFGGGKKAMGSYIAPTYILKKAGLVAGKDYTVRFAKNPPSAVIAIFNKAADAAGAGNIILKVKGVTKKVDVTQMKVLAESPSFTHLTWAVNKSMSDAKASKIQKIMTGLKKNAPEVLKSAKVTNFHKSTDADFKEVREIVKYALEEEL